MNSLENRIKFLIYLESFTNTDVVYNSIRAYYIVSIVSSDTILPSLKTIMLLAVFLTEIPSGYIADRFGNKKVLIFAKLLSFAAMILFLIARNTAYFIVIYLFLGLSSSLESGSKNAFLLNVCYSNGVDYKNLKVNIMQKITIYKILMSAIGSLLFLANQVFPFLFTALMYLISLLSILFMPKVNIVHKREVNNVSSLKDSFRIIKKILASKKVLYSFVAYTIVTTCLIFIFDYYQIYFEIMGIPIQYFGLIYAAFKLFNYLGGTLFKKNLPRYVSLIFICITFVMFVFVSPITIFFAIIIQQIFYNYEDINFQYVLLEALETEKEGALFESIISFIYSISRILLLQCIIMIIKFIDMNASLIIIAIMIAILSIIALAKNRRELNS